MGTDLDIRDGRGFLAGAQGVFGVVQHVHLDAEIAPQGVNQR